MASPRSTLPLEADQLLEALDGVALHAGTQSLANDAVQVDEHTESEEVVDLVLVGGESTHQSADRLLSGLVELREVVEGCRLVMVVVVDVEARGSRAPRR